MITIITTLTILYLIGLGYCIKMVKETYEFFDHPATLILLSLIFIVSPLIILLEIGFLLFKQHKNSDI